MAVESPRPNRRPSPLVAGIVATNIAALVAMIWGTALENLVELVWLKTNSSLEAADRILAWNKLAVPRMLALYWALTALFSSFGLVHRLGRRYGGAPLSLSRSGAIVRALAVAVPFGALLAGATALLD